MPERFAQWRRTLIEQNPEAEHFLWTEKTIPSLGLDLAQLKRDHLTMAGASNVVRLKAVLDHGGMYLDTDIEPLKPIDNILVYSAIAARQDGDRLCNAFFGAEAGHPWIRWQWDRVDQQKGIPAYWGVDLMSAAPRAGVTIVPSEVCYPYLWDAPAEKRVPHEASQVVHHWEGSWNKK